MNQKAIGNVLGVAILLVIIIGGVVFFLAPKVITQPPPISIQPIPPPTTSAPSGSSSATLTICFADGKCETKQFVPSLFSAFYPQSSVALLDEQSRPIAVISSIVYVKTTKDLSYSSTTKYVLTVMDQSNANRNLTISRFSNLTLPGTVAGISYKVAEVQFTPTEVLEKATSLGLNQFNVQIRYTTLLKGLNVITTGKIMLNNMKKSIISEQVFSPVLDGGTITFDPPSEMVKIYISKISIMSDKSARVEVTVSAPYQKTLHVYVTPIPPCTGIFNSDWCFHGFDNSYPNGICTNVIASFTTYSGVVERSLSCGGSGPTIFISGLYQARLHDVDVGDIQTVSFTVP